MSRFYSLLVVVTIFIFAAANWNCGTNSQSKTKHEDDELVIPVEVAEVTTGDISAYFAGTATLEAEEETDVVAKVGGVVEKIYVEEGDYVKAGQILVKLDDEKLTVQLQQAEANLMKLENDYNRSEELFNKSLISAEEFQNAKYEFEAQKANYNLAKLNLDYTSIRAPISGIIAERKIKVGNMLVQNQATFRITGSDPLLAIIHVPEKQISKMKVGQTTRLSVDALQGKKYQGTVDRISPVVDPNTGTVKVTVSVHDKNQELMPGMFARINIVYDVRKNTTLVPKNAILAEDKESSVFVVRDSVAYRQPIEVGYVNTTHTEVLTGVKAGDLIVTTGQGSLKDSSKVELVSTKPKLVN